jgi:HSP20 family molecular chaperone IbpA
VRRILGWLRGDVDAFERAHTTEVTPDVVDRFNIDINVELHGDGDTGSEPRIRQEEGETIIEIDLPGLSEDTVQIDRHADELLVTGERSAGPFEVQIRAQPAPQVEDIAVTYADDVLTLVVPPPF